MTPGERRLTRLEPETQEDGSVQIVLIEEPKSAETELLLNAAARGAALPAFLPARPYTVRRPVPIKP